MGSWAHFCPHYTVPSLVVLLYVVSLKYKYSIPLLVQNSWLGGFTEVLIQ